MKRHGPARAGVSNLAQRRAISRAARIAEDEEEEALLSRAQDAVEAAERLNSSLHAKLNGATKQTMDIMQDIAAWEASFNAINSENERLTEEAAALAAVNGGIWGPGMNRIPAAVDDDVRSQSSSHDCVSLD